MSESRPPEPSPPETSSPTPVSVVHLRRAEYEDPAIRAIWQRRGFATLGPTEGHDPYVRCPICSTDTPPEPCPCGYPRPCPLAALLGRARTNGAPR